MNNVYVELNNDDGAQKLIRKFKRKCDLFGVTKEYKKRKYHSKPSDELRAKREESLKRKRKQERKARRYKTKSSL